MEGGGTAPVSLLPLTLVVSQVQVGLLGASWEARLGLPGVALGRLLQTPALTLSPPGRSPARPSASFSSETWQGESTCPSSHQCRGLPCPSILPEAGMALRASLDSQAAQTLGAARASGGHTHEHTHPHGHTPTQTHTHGHTHMNTYTNTHTHTPPSPQQSCTSLEP